MGVTTLPVAGSAFQEQQFTSSGTWTAPNNVTKVWVLVVGGGANGGAANSFSPGGNAGAQLQSQLTVVPGTAYTVTVGAGGGNASVFGSLTASGGTGTGGSTSTGSWSAGGSSYGPGAGTNGGAAGANTGGGGAGSSSGGGAGGSGIVIVRWLG
jgi:hypothetical protein